MNSRFVFLDPRGRRWPKVRRTAFLAGLLALTVGLLFFQTLYFPPELPSAVLHSRQTADFKPAQGPAPKVPKSPRVTARISRGIIGSNAKATADVRLGFCSSGDSTELVLEHAKALTHLAPDWFSLGEEIGSIQAEADRELAEKARKAGLVLLPVLENREGDRSLPESVEILARATAPVREQFANKLVKLLEESLAAGVVLNWEEISSDYSQELTALIATLSARLHQEGMQLWVVVPCSNDFGAYDIPALAPLVDRFVATLHGETSELEEPGPLASQEWFEDWVQTIAGFGNPTQWIGALGTCGYDWTSGEKQAESISFADAICRAEYAGVHEVGVSLPTLNSTFSYYEKGTEHTVWFLDAITFANQLRKLQQQGWGGVALQQLGTEDPGIWKVLAKRSGLKNPDRSLLRELEEMSPENAMANISRGEVVSVDVEREPGRRKVQFLEGRFTSQYVDMPTYPTLYRVGGQDKSQVVLSFDDGPDPEWTPQILDILKQLQVKATFFVVGSRAEANPELIKRIVKEGHLLGNHSYTHANLAESSDEQVNLELNATQRLIEALTGFSTLLFRPPYDADSRPTSLEELRPIKRASDLNYLTVLESIDPQDWSGVSAHELLQRVKDQRNQGQIVLLHDGGGDRSETVAALPWMIRWLRERGDAIVPLDQLLGVDREKLMPQLEIKNQGRFFYLVGSAGFFGIRLAEHMLWNFVIFATVLLVARALIVAILALVHRRRSTPALAMPLPPISVLVAAYNEEKVIKQTLESILATDYPAPIEVVVVDDGSSDATAAKVAALKDERITLIRKANEGKATALRVALETAKHETIVFLDADTHFQPDTLRELVAPMGDPKVAAVSGNAKVGNLRAFLARCQSMEYICGFNLDRRAYTVWNCVTVVPGAIGVFRKSVIEKAGGLSLDTLAEDTDLTLQIHRLGYRIEFAPRALAWTEAPETIPALARQRFRWAFGTLQCLWKNRDLLFSKEHPALGWFALPGIWFFHILLVALTPVIDLFLLASLLFGNGLAIWPYFAAFLAIDLLLAMVACRIEGEPVRRIWIVIPMRLIYRPLLSWVVWRSILKALQGAFVGWGKLDRTASVRVETKGSQPC